MISEHIERLLAKYDSTLPIEHATTIPKEWYTDPAFLSHEYSTTFSQNWQCAGRSEQIREPGHFFTTTIANEPILVIRSDDGIIRGFFNVCRHKAAAVVTEHAGETTKIRCQYHGWTYDLRGNLRGLPEFDGVEAFCKEQNGLIPIGAVCEIGGLVWVHLETVREPADSYLAPLIDWFQTRLTNQPLRFAYRHTYDLQCNWKVYVDNYLDGGYHINTIHPGLASVLDYKDYRTILCHHSVVQKSPLKDATADVGTTRVGDEAAYWWIYPNFMINHYSGVMDTNLVVPVDQTRCRVIFDYYFAPHLDAEFIEKSIDVADHVQREDVGVCEDVQRGLNSRSYSVGRLSVKRETGIHHFHRLHANQLRNNCNL